MGIKLIALEEKEYREIYHLARLRGVVEEQIITF